ncbi:BQ2448_6507 [Microbotryum intermedium]|uniref:BQ2448_6507 protein n=1 Tax=Microbotryum intermedium TaxID=269621 RepID=A0A238FLN8_9BASI|nr:BQ2448_6507 [Microbotryum intermedium]
MASRLRSPAAVPVLVHHTPTSGSGLGSEMNATTRGDQHASTSASTSSSQVPHHERRISNPALASSMPVSYAYGAPPAPVGSSPHGSPVSRSSNRRTNTTGGDANDGQSTSSNSRRRGHRRSQSLLRGEVETGQDESILIEDEDNEEEEDEDSFELEKQRRLEREESIGRSLEPAAVRYARLAERKRNTGSAIRQPTNFRTATTTGASSTSASTSKTRPTTDLNDTSVNIANAFAAAVKGTFSAEGLMRVGGKRATMPAATQETVDHDEDGEEEDSGKETHHAGGGAGTDGTGDTTSEEELSEEARAKAKRPKKTTNTSSPERERGNDAAKEQAPGQRKTSPNAKRKSTATDSAYKPAGELEATSEDDVSNDTIARRRKNKGKGRASTGSATSNAIPIGRRDNDVWQKAKKKRGRKSRDAGEGDEEEAAGSDNALGHDDDDDGDMGGMEHDFEPDVSVEPPSVSFFLRDKSPSFDRTQASAQKEMATPQLKLGGYPTSSPGTHSPFQPLRAFTFGFGGRGASAAAPPVHPSIDEFDQTLNAGHAQPSHSFSRSLSLDDSLTRGSSYDYSEEERIVAALEEQRRLNKLAAEQSKGNAGDGVNSLTAGLRRRHRLSGAPALAGIQEEAQHERKSGIGAFLGRLLYRLLAGVWRTIQDPLLDWSKIWRAIGLLLLGLLAMVYLIPKLTSDLPSKSTSSSEHSSIIHYVPFFRPSSTYRAPAAPADSLEELIARLTSLEGAMGQLSSLSDLDRTRTKADHQLLSKMAEQLSSLEQILSNERQNAAKALESSVKANAKQNRELEKTLKGARADLDALVTRVQTFQDAHSGDAADLRKLKASIDAAAKDIASLGGKVAQVAQDVRKGLDGERMAKLALEAIEQRLPAKVAVKVNENGKVEVDATFWQYLRDAFVDKKQVETIVNGKVARELAKLPLKTDGDAPPAPIVIHESPKWDEFLEANDAALRALVSSHIEGRTGSDAIVTRKAFLDTLRREIKTLKADFEAKANENVEKIGQELLRKVAKQDEMKRKESGSGGLASHLHLPFSGHKGSDSGASAGIPSDNMAALVSSLVDSALLRYSKDVLARPDYALFTAGGRVVRTLTSPTYEANPLGASRRALAWVTGTAGPRGRPPVTALHPDNTPGSCWPFVGSTGQLGIQLSRSIVPSDVTIEHVSVDVSLDGTVASAPREFEVWGVVESRSDIERLARYRYEQQETRREAEAQGDEEAKDVELDPPTSIPPTPNHILLAIGSYDAASPTPIQTFPVTPMARQLAIPVQVVILKVLSNHGESAYTCLYRVRVGGMSTTTSAQ